jgi:hypothetical protein
MHAALNKTQSKRERERLHYCEQIISLSDRFRGNAAYR